MIKHLKPRSKGRVAYLRIKDYVMKFFRKKGVRGGYGQQGCPVGEPGPPGWPGVNQGMQGTVGTLSFRHSRRAKEYFEPIYVPMKGHKKLYHVNKTP